MARPLGTEFGEGVRWPWGTPWQSVLIEVKPSFLCLFSVPGTCTGQELHAWLHSWPALQQGFTELPRLHCATLLPQPPQQLGLHTTAPAYFLFS